VAVEARTVLVTGGNRGIGKAIALAFQAAGHRVAVTHRGSGAPEGVLGVKADVTDTVAVGAAFDAVEAELGPVQIVVANAGIADDALLLRMTEEQFSGVLDTNLTGAFRVAKRAIPRMVRGRYGRLIFVSSVVGLLGSAGQANYAAAKAGLVGFSRSLARELGSRNITANVIAPGFVQTDMTNALSEQRRNEIAAAVPLRRYAQPEEIADVCVFLGSESAAYITGAVIPVDGGLGMGH
jgi:3-oxoacyl-[acyl-carrier protein] reductase